MARFRAAKIWGAMDEAFQKVYNYLIDLLDTGYWIEQTVDGKLVRVEISPQNIISVWIDGIKVFGLDISGQLFAASLSNKEDSDVYASIGQVGSKIGILLYKRSISTTVPVMRFVIGSGSSADPGFHWEYMGKEVMYYDNVTNGWFRKVDDVIRERIYPNGDYHIADHNATIRFAIDHNGIMRLLDHNGKVRIYFYADGGIELLDPNGARVFAAAGGASNSVELTCKSDSGMRIGVDDTGPYYVKAGAKTYF